MVEGWVLVEGNGINTEALRSVSLMNAMQLVVGSVPSSGTMLHVAANSSEDFGKALLEFAKVQGVSGVFPLAVRVR